MSLKIEIEADREYKRAYDREWYRKHAKQVRARNAAQYRALHQWYEKYKIGLACQRCGENYPATLIFHHRNQNDKEFSIAQAVHKGWSIERIVKETEKCDVLCTNCHKRLHGSAWIN